MILLDYRAINGVAARNRPKVIATGSGGDVHHTPHPDSKRLVFAIVLLRQYAAGVVESRAVVVGAPRAAVGAHKNGVVRQILRRALAIECA